MAGSSRFHSNFLTAACAVLLLGGCSIEPPWGSADDDTRAAVPTSEIGPEYDGANSGRSAYGTLSGRTKLGTLAAVPKAKPAPPHAAVEELALIGLDEIEAQRTFGPPDYIVRQPPATRWRYTSSTCTLDLYFYQDVETRRLRILAYDIAAPKLGADDDKLAGCSTTIRSEKS